MTESTEGTQKCEVAPLQNLVPTGIAGEIGGLAGDATPIATLMASICDKLITHPNVLNGSDLIDISSNTMYVEGSAISRLLMGSIGLQPVRANRVLEVIDPRPDEFLWMRLIMRVISQF